MHIKSDKNKVKTNRRDRNRQINRQTDTVIKQASTW